MTSRQPSLRQRLLPGGGSGRDGGSPLPSGQSGQAARVLANLVNSGIGTSTVAVALALRRLGLAPALAAMAAQAALGILANHIISRESDRAGCDSYHDLLCARYGKWGGRAVAIAQAINSLGKTVVWLIILADLIVGSSGDGSGLLPELLRAAGRPQAAEGGWYLRRWPWIILVAVAATPVVSVHSIDKLSGVSLVGNGAVALMTAVSMGLAVLAVHRHKGHALHWLPDAEGRSKRSEALEVLSVLPVLMGAAFTQNNINSVMHEVRPYHQGLLDVAQAAARLLTIGVFVAIGVSNNVVFGGDLQPDVLLNYSSQGLAGLLPRGASLGLAAAMKLCFLINGLLSLPMYLYPYQRNLWAALPDESAEERMGDRRSFAATNTASLAGCAAIAVLVPSVWKPLKLLGGTAVSLMAFVFPGMVVLKLGWSGDVWHRSLWLLSCLLVAVGLLQCAASIASQFT